MKGNKRRHKKQNQSVDSITRRADSALKSKHYKEAIVLYKKLAQNQAGGRWQTVLQEAYVGRAKQLAEKGLHKEALVMLRNAPSVKTGDRQCLQIYCLIESGDSSLAIKLFSENRSQLTPLEIQQIESLLGLLIVAGHGEILDLLPEDSNTKNHYPLIQSVIQNYCIGADEKLAESFQKIPFRSPYRDLKSIISALTHFSVNQQKALDTLAKVDRCSAFKTAVDSVALAIGAESENIQLDRQPEAIKSFVYSVQGVNKDIAALIANMSKAQNSVKALFSGFQGCFGNAELKLIQPLLHRLIPRFAPGIKAYEKCFGELSAFERNRIAALSYEVKDEIEAAMDAWELALKTLDDDAKFGQNNTVRAMILRRIANNADLEYGKFSAKAEELLEESLKYDPNDLPTFYRLFALYKKVEDEKGYRSCIERAVKRFPEDAGVLMASIELAIERGTFKKAANLAKQLLKKDSLNTRARMFLINAHLAHANKQIMNNRFDLAAKEIKEAEKFEKPGSAAGVISLFYGMLAYARNNPVDGDRRIEEASNMMGSYVRGYFMASVEMSFLKLPKRHQKKYIGLLKNTAAQTPDKLNVLNLVNDIQRYNETPEYDLTTTLSALKKYFYSAVSLDFRRDEMELICDIFEKLESFQILMDFALKAVERWPDDPIFIYFQVFASSRGMPSNMNPLDSRRLDQAMELAEEKSNSRVGSRILDFYERDNFALNMIPEVLGGKINDIIGSIFDEKVLQELFEMEDDDDIDVIKPKRPKKSKSGSSILDIFK